MQSYLVWVDPPHNEIKCNTFVWDKPKKKIYIYKHFASYINHIILNKIFKWTGLGQQMLFLCHWPISIVRLPFYSSDQSHDMYGSCDWLNKTYYQISWLYLDMYTSSIQQTNTYFSTLQQTKNKVFFRQPIRPLALLLSHAPCWIPQSVGTNLSFYATTIGYQHIQRVFSPRTIPLTPCACRFVELSEETSWLVSVAWAEKRLCPDSTL